jgi:aminopeptidase N
MSQLQSMVGIIAHEFAHQWFGNRVAPQWWEFVWLNEGFATFYEFKGANLAYPEWRAMDLMVVTACQTVLERDAYATTRPMNYYIEDPDSVLKIFDFVAYSKGIYDLEYINWFWENI